MGQFAGRARRRGLAVIVGLAVASGLAYRLAAPRGPEPPTVSIATLDPAVAKAIEAGREQVRKNRRSGKAWGELGSVLFAHSLYPDSLPCFEEAERLEPKEPRWPYLQALVHIHEQPEKAVECLDRAIARGGSHLAPRLRRAETLLALERWDDARSAFADILAQHPDHPRASLGIGLLAGRQGKWYECRRLLTPLATNPTCQRAATAALAEAVARTGDSAAAARYTAALEDMSKDVPWEDPLLESAMRHQVGTAPRLIRSNELIARGQNGEAEQLLNEIIADDPRSAEAYQNLGRVCLSMRANARAAKALETAVSLQADAPYPHFLLGVARFQMGEYQAAIKALTSATTLQPDYALAHYTVGQCQAKLKNHSAAIAAYRNAIRYRPNLAEAHLALGSALMDAGDRGTARECLENALRLKPDDPDAQRWLAKAK